MPTSSLPPTAAIIGAGPAGLMAAEMLSTAGIAVTLFEAMPAPARKFLMAGKSGLNITHAEPLEIFLTRYIEKGSLIEAAVRDFPPEDIMSWMAELGMETHTGPTGRVFPVTMKASPLLRAWLARLGGKSVTLQTRHRWTGWDGEGRLQFDTPQGPVVVSADAAIFALGGASWSRLGSNGAWAEIFEAKAIPLAPFRPSNSGFLVPWSERMKGFAGAPVKNARLTIETPDGPISTRSEFVVTKRGIESGGVYQLSAPLREMIERQGDALLYLDLLPDMEEAKLTERLARPRGKQSIGNHLRKSVRLDGVKKAVLFEGTDREVFNDPARLARAIKEVPLNVTGMAPIDEAISTTGGVRLDALDDGLMVKALPGTFCAGEMLDWDAPTGGYLLTACLATGRRAGEAARHFLLDVASREA